MWQDGAKRAASKSAKVGIKIFCSIWLSKKCFRFFYLGKIFEEFVVDLHESQQPLQELKLMQGVVIFANTVQCFECKYNFNLTHLRLKD